MRDEKTFICTAAVATAWMGLAAGQPADSAWPMFRHDAAHTGMSPHAGPSVPLLSWSYRLGDEIWNSSPAIDGNGTVYIAPYSAADRHIYAVDSLGGMAWSYRAGAWLMSSPAIAANGDIFVGSGNFLIYALRSDGTLRWTYSADLNVNSSPCIGGSGNVYIGSSDNVLYSLRSGGTLRWSYRTQDHLDSSPALGDAEGVYLGSVDNRIYALDSIGRLRWSYATRDDVYSSPAVGSNRVYVGSCDNRVYVLGLNGSFRWSYNAGDFVQSSPALGADETVYAGSRNGRFFALASDGSRKWTYFAGDCVWSSPALGSDGTVYFGSWDNRVYALDSGGALVWSYSTGEAIYSSPSLGADGRIYVGSVDNNLYCIGPTITPTPAMTPTATPPVDLIAQKAEFSTTDRIEVAADVWPFGTPCWPFVRVLMAAGSTLYYQSGVGFSASPVPYLGFDAGPMTVSSPILGYPCLDASFSGIATGTYYLEGGLVDATRTTSASNLVYFGTVDREGLAVR